MGWFMMTRTRCHEDVCEEEYLECEVEGGGTWSGENVLMGFRKEKSVEGITGLRLRNKSAVFGESWLLLKRIVLNGMRLSGVLGSLVPMGSV